MAGRSVHRDALTWSLLTNWKAVCAGLSESQIKHFRSWVEREGKFVTKRTGPPIKSWKFTLWVLRYVLSTRTSLIPHYGSVAISDHKNRAFVNVMHQFGLRLPEPVNQDYSFPHRLLSAIVCIPSALSTFARYRRSLRKFPEMYPGVKANRRGVENALAKGLAQYMLLTVDLLKNPSRTSSVVLSASLSLRRMWLAFAASATATPMYLVFLEDPRTATTGVASLLDGARIAGCIAHEMADPVLAGVPPQVPVALFPPATRARPRDQPPWRLGIVCARLTNLERVISFAMSALESQATESVALRLHPSASSAQISDVRRLGGRLRVDSGQSLGEFGARLDVVVTAGTSAENALIRQGLPCWGLASALPHPRRSGTWHTGLFVIPIARASGKEFMDGLDCAVLRNCLAQIQSTSLGASVCDEDIRPVTLHSLAMEIAFDGRWTTLKRR